MLKGCASGVVVCDDDGFIFATSPLLVEGPELTAGCPNAVRASRSRYSRLSRQPDLSRRNEKSSQPLRLRLRSLDLSRKSDARSLRQLMCSASRKPLRRFRFKTWT
jgi:hypothetical protein